MLVTDTGSLHSEGHVNSVCVVASQDLAQALAYAVCPAHNDQNNIGATAEI